MAFFPHDIGGAVNMKLSCPNSSSVMLLRICVKSHRNLWFRKITYKVSNFLQLRGPICAVLFIHPCSRFWCSNEEIVYFKKEKEKRGDCLMCLNRYNELSFLWDSMACASVFVSCHFRDRDKSLWAWEFQWCMLRVQRKN